MIDNDAIDSAVEWFIGTVLFLLITLMPFAAWWPQQTIQCLCFVPLSALIVGVVVYVREAMRYDRPDNDH